MKVDGQFHAPDALLPGKRSGTHFTGWAPGQLWTGVKFLAHIGISSPDRPAL